MKSINYILFLVLVLGLTSCEEVIEIDLNSSAPQVVLEAQFNANLGLLTVTASYTSDYFDTARAVTIDNAIIDVQLNDSVIVPIASVGNGIYQSVVPVVFGATYTLTATINGVDYTATSVLNHQPSVLSAQLMGESGGGFGPGGGGQNAVNVTIVDIKDEANYYRLQYIYKNRVYDGSFSIRMVNDVNLDGELITAAMLLNQNSISRADSIEIVVTSLDKSTFDYYTAINDLNSSGDNPLGGSSAPGNPTTNWSNKALGYFSAFSFERVLLTIP